MKKLRVFYVTIIMMILASTFVYADEEYKQQEFKNIGIEVSIPSDMYVMTRYTGYDDTVKKFGIDSEKILEQYVREMVDNDEYFVAKFGGESYKIKLVSKAFKTNKLSFSSDELAEEAEILLEGQIDKNEIIEITPSGTADRSAVQVDYKTDTVSDGCVFIIYDNFQLYFIKAETNTGELATGRDVVRHMALEAKYTTKANEEPTTFTIENSGTKSGSSIIDAVLGVAKVLFIIVLVVVVIFLIIQILNGKLLKTKKVVTYGSRQDPRMQDRLRRIMGDSFDEDKLKPHLTPTPKDEMDLLMEDDYDEDDVMEASKYEESFTPEVPATDDEVKPAGTSEI